MTYHISKNGKTINLEIASHEISSGGQGTIYKVVSPVELVGYCVKIYNNEHQAKENQRKIEYMVSNKPQNRYMNKIRICWPEYIVYDNLGEFVGYMMVLAFEGSRDLKIIELYSAGKTIAQKFPQYVGWHNKFELDSPIGFVNRLKMLHNWALAVEIIHQTGKYVIVDVKPDNVLATSDGKISIVDTDSFQIIDGVVQYQAPVVTPEYFAKFAKDRYSQQLLQTADCDCFSLAVSFYKILIGVHPYSGFKLLPPYNTDEYSNIASHIDADLFVFGRNQKFIQLLETNNMHARFAKLPKYLQSLFIRAFTTNDQPSATLWKEAIKDVYKPGSRIKVPYSNLDANGNSESLSLCVLVIDVSGSMKICINTLNRALEQFIVNLREGKNGFDETSKYQLELAIIQFDSECDVVRGASLIEEKERIPQLRVRGLKTNTATAIRRAMNIVEDRKCQYKASGCAYYRPWIVLLTDGNPNPYNESEIESLIADVNSGIQQHRFLFTAIGIGTHVDEKFLRRLSNGKFAYITQTDISSFFEKLSESFSIPDVLSQQDDLLGQLSQHLPYDV